MENKKTNIVNPDQYNAMNEERRKMRGKIIHFLCLMGMVKQGKPDYDRINEFIINIGSRNPKKKILNYLYHDELQEVLTQVESMYRNEVGRFNKPRNGQKPNT